MLHSPGHNISSNPHSACFSGQIMPNEKISLSMLIFVSSSSPYSTSQPSSSTSSAPTYLSTLSRFSLQFFRSSTSLSTQFARFFPLSISISSLRSLSSIFEYLLVFGSKIKFFKVSGNIAPGNWMLKKPDGPCFFSFGSITETIMRPTEQEKWLSEYDLLIPVLLFKTLLENEKHMWLFEYDRRIPPAFPRKSLLKID
ncbi:hypothetical protein ACJIZ3_018548 [Penstemon smallii]|uniref:Uncharacterized protein n=1 Tax=Penstemon smallii TaxID=265156 RepID=A0ABD3SYL7_9LAMI